MHHPHPATADRDEAQAAPRRSPGASAIASRGGVADDAAQLAHLLWIHVPEARVTVRQTGQDEDDAGIAIDIGVDDFRTHAVWSPDRGFGLFLGEPRDGQRPDETYASPQLAAARLRAMIEASRAGTPPAPMSIAEVRKLLGRRQRDVARMLSVQQASISRFEGRRNPTLGALRAVVEAIGGQLEVRVRSANLDVPITLPEPGQEEGERDDLRPTGRKV